MYYFKKSTRVGDLESLLTREEKLFLAKALEEYARLGEADPQQLGRS